MSVFTQQKADTPFIGWHKTHSLTPIIYSSITDGFAKFLTSP